MKQIAIKGHPTRGEEVIEILEMLGGVNAIENSGNNTNVAYFISETYKNWITCQHPLNLDDFIILTLEEFLEKYPYKVGDKAFAFGNKCTIIDTVWDESIKEVVYTIKLDTSKYTTTKLSYQLQPYKEEIIEAGIDYTMAIRNNYKTTIKRAQEYLRTHLWEGKDDDNDPIVESVHNITLNDFIKDFTRYLEE